MKKVFRYFLSLFFIFALLGLVASAQAEEETLSIMAPWEGQGRVFQIGPEKLKFLGSFEGRIPRSNQYFSRIILPRTLEQIGITVYLSVIILVL